tara:strand:- start:262 stop:387 length:126 start_codon:yes stop_codon:yes gene_type:complete
LKFTNAVLCEEHHEEEHEAEGEHSKAYEIESEGAYRGARKI